MTLKTHLRWIFSFIIDFTLIHVLSFILIISTFIKFDNKVILYSCMYLIYSIISATNKGKSVGRELMKIQIDNKTSEYSKIKIFTRDFLFQWGIFFILPMSLIQYFTSISLILLTTFIVINTLSWIIFKINVVDLLANTKTIRKTDFKWENKIGIALLCSWIIDLAIVFSITLLINLFLIQWIYIKFIILFLIVLCFYSSASYGIASTTFGKFFFGFSIRLKNGNPISLAAVLKRELLLKIGLGCTAPLLLMLVLGWNNVNLLMSLIAVCNIVIAIVYYSCKKDLWWNTFANTNYTRKFLSETENIIKYIVLLFFIGFAYLVMLKYNNYENNGKQNFLGFNFPFKKTEYPNNNNVKTYIDFLSTNKLQDPKDYILSLFEKNDIVILCENNHLEDSQWDMIYSVVSDSVFINKVGNVFTEYGNVKNQSKVNAFLKTNYQNDTLLQKSAATLMNYHGGNYYRFVTKLNKLNSSLTDSLKVDLFFTDIMPHSYLIFDLPPIEQLMRRDSLMASVVVNWYKKTKKKCLVITNYRHAFAINKNHKVQKPSFFNRDILKVSLFKNEAQYIYNNFPNNTSNVMIYGDGSNFINAPIPIQDGKWNTALKNYSRPVGFDFDKSPFGNDYFDFYPTQGRNSNLTYKDVFTGFVFYKTKEEHSYSSQLYAKYAAQQEYNEILNHTNIDSNLLKKRVEQYKDFHLPENNNPLNIYLNIYYYIDIIMFFILTFIAILIVVFDFFLTCKLRVKKENT